VRTTPPPPRPGSAADKVKRKNLKIINLSSVKLGQVDKLIGETVKTSSKNLQ